MILDLDTSKPVDRTGNSFCGPLVVAAILGVSTGEVAAEVAAQRRKVKGVRLPSGRVLRARGRSADKVRATYHTEMLELLERHGYKTEVVDTGARLRRWKHNVLVNENFTRWASKQPLLSAAVWLPASMLKVVALSLWQARGKFTVGTFIIGTPGHWALISNGKWCETFTDGKWVDLRAAPCSNRHVIHAWRVTRAGVES